MLHRICLASLLGLAVPALAQDTYWIANRASSDIMQVSPWGKVLQRIAMPTTLRSAHVAPNGKVWVVRFGQPTFDIVDPVTAAITPIASVLGSPYQIAFDAAGHGWVSGGTGVQEFDAAGTFIASYPTTTAPLGITVDSLGNKWIAHRTTPASVTRIDPAGVITNFAITGATMLPTAIIADYRGLLNPSHMWVVGDSVAQLAEIDELGNTVNLFPLPTTNVGSVVFDKNGHIWVGSFGTGALLEIDPATGIPLSTYSSPPNVIGIAMDSYGRLVTTCRVTFSGVGPPCELRRISAATGALEVPTLLQFGGFSASGTQASVSTQFQYALVVAPFNDMDGDGEANFSEVLNGTSPTDPTANALFRVESFGATSTGSTMSFDIQAAPTTAWAVGFSFTLIPPTPVPGFGGLLRIDPTILIQTNFGVGNQSIPFTLLPSWLGIEAYVQGLDLSTFTFLNTSGIKIW